MIIIPVLVLGGLVPFLMWWTEPTEKEIEDKQSRQENY